MKKLFVSLVALAIVSVSFAQKTIKDVAKLNSEVIDQGKLKQGNPQTAKFVVTNISNEPIIIETASPTCGCTIGDYTKSPIEPGKTGYITATYNAANVGHFDKTLTVKFAGINETMPIKITGDVLSAEEYDKQGGGTSAPAITKTEEVVKPAMAVTTAPAKPVVTSSTKVKTAKAKTKTKTATAAPATKK